MGRDGLADEVFINYWVGQQNTDFGRWVFDEFFDCLNVMKLETYDIF